MITIKVTYDDVASRRKIAQIRAMLDPIRLNSVAGRAGVNVVRSHLLELEQGRPNQLGGARQHYYSRAADSTHYTAMQKSALVTVSYIGFRLRRFGGVVRPDKKRFLTIPVASIAYGRRVSDFKDTFIIRSKKTGKAFVADRPAGSILRILFRLTTQATIPADSTIMPFDYEVKDGVTPAIQSYIKRQARRIEAAQTVEGQS